MLTPEQLWRFHQKLLVHVESGCWLWLGCTDRDGYGQFSVNRHTCRAHRAAYEHYVGHIADDLHLDHLCRNRSCVNPEHLEPVTNAENTRRGAMVITHCPAGHEYTDENTYLHRNKQHCRCCRSNRQALRRAIA